MVLGGMITTTIICILLVPVLYVSTVRFREGTAPVHSTPQSAKQQVNYMWPAMAQDIPSVPVESDAVINKDVSLSVIGPAVGLIRAHGWRCDSVSALVPFIMSRGLSIKCNHFNYSYEIADRGGNWEVTLK
jgi:hypothetical protein